MKILLILAAIIINQPIAVYIDYNCTVPIGVDHDKYRRKKDNGTAHH